MKKAIILLNMGGPRNLDEVNIFLKNMFNDKNIIQIKSTFLRKIIAFIISNLRLKIAQENYKKIGGYSPIFKHTNKLQQKLSDILKDIYITFAMRYTPPFCNEVLDELRLREIDEIFAIPLYPHFSTTTTKSSLEDLELNLKKRKYTGTLRFIERFYDNKSYNKLLIKLIKKSLDENSPKNYDLLFSAHSLPEKIIKNGDTYQKEVISHSEILKNMLKEEGVLFNEIHLAYQSKLGPIPWLKPNVSKILSTMKNKKVIVCPLSFTIDNSETDFELSIEYAKLAKKLNFKDYRVVSCPNDDDDFVRVLVELYENPIDLY